MNIKTGSIKVIGAIFLIAILLTTGCSTELGHQDHDHDGDGIQDHTPEEHDESENLEGHEEDLTHDSEEDH